jgi:hypothetical protein
MAPTVLAKIVVVFLAGAGFVALAYWRADSNTKEISNRLHESAKTRAATGAGLKPEERAELQALANQTVALVPGNGGYWAIKASVQTDPVAAYEAIKGAVVSYPTVPFMWMELLRHADGLYVEGKLPEGKVLMERALERAVSLGRHEVQVLATVADIGFANWSIFDAPTQLRTLEAAKSLAEVQPEMAVSIAARRGKLELICSDSRVARQKPCIAVGGGIAKAG